MPLPCPACGFLTGDESLYGTYNICPICAWEDDPVQLANPACGGGANRESLIDAQIVAVAKYPLNVMVTAKISRGSQWRPLNAAERETAETEKQVALWIHKGICDPEKVYWMTSNPDYS